MRLIIEPIVRAALLEDLGRAGDITTEAIVPEGAEVDAVIAARQPGVVAGLDTRSWSRHRRLTLQPGQRVKWRDSRRRPRARRR